jgi:hypothetical protein
MIGEAVRCPSPLPVRGGDPQLIVPGNMEVRGSNAIDQSTSSPLARGAKPPTRQYASDGNPIFAP